MEQKEKFSSESFFLENVLEMILIFDCTGLISYANKAARQKLEYYDDLCGRNIIEIFPNDFKTEGNDFEASDYKGDDFQYLVAYRKNLTCFPVEAKIIENIDCPEMYICMFNDILEKEFLNREVERIRQEADEANRVKSEFVSNVTHELRTPVNGVQGNVREMMARNMDEETQKQLHLIERCCDDMNKIINDILDFSELETGKYMLESGKFNFRNMMDIVKNNHKNKITEKGLEFFVTVSPQVPEFIIGDESHITQILDNLLSNALKFTSEGKITVEVFRTAQINNKIELFFVVSDTGIGIDKEDKNKLFKSFSQVDASISRKYGGTGLGLNISKQLVELMGGNIEVESEKNVGSNFVFSIWVEDCEGAEELIEAKETENYEMFLQNIPDISDEIDDTMKYGTDENKENLKRNLSKLILCVEMENWEKAETFMESIRQLTQDAPSEVKRVVLRLKMAIQKENYDKVNAEYAELKIFL